MEHLHSPQEEPRTILLHKKTGGQVFHMLSIFDAIVKVHCCSNHLVQEKTLVSCKSALYSAKQDLVRIYCESYYICMEKNPMVPPRKRAKKPRVSSNFHDRFQVNLIDMRKMLRRISTVSSSIGL